jgi:hypothetical protein
MKKVKAQPARGEESAKPFRFNILSPNLVETTFGAFALFSKRGYSFIIPERQIHL